LGGIKKERGVVCLKGRKKEDVRTTQPESTNNSPVGEGAVETKQNPSRKEGLFSGKAGVGEGIDSLWAMYKEGRGPSSTLSREKGGAKREREGLPGSRKNFVRRKGKGLNS